MTRWGGVLLGGLLAANAYYFFVLASHSTLWSSPPPAALKRQDETTPTPTTNPQQFADKTETEQTNEDEEEEEEEKEAKAVPKGCKKNWNHIKLFTKRFGSKLTPDKDLPDKPTRGLISLAVGAKSATEVVGLAASLLRFDTSVNFTIFTDTTTLPLIQQKLSKLFNGPCVPANFAGHVRTVDITPRTEGVNHKRPSHMRVYTVPKIAAIAEHTYDYSLFVDSDMFFCRAFNLDQLWLLLLQYDFAGTIAPAQYKPHCYRDNVPDTFFEINSGFLLYKHNQITARVFDTWMELLHSKPSPNGMDQPPFREAVWMEHASLYTLPYIYNCRMLSSCGQAKECFTAHIHRLLERDELLAKCLA